MDREAQEAGLPAFALMEHAARSVAELVCLLGPLRETSVLVVCGPGNNGGDGYSVARMLAGWGRSVRVVSLGPDPQSEDAARAAALCRRFLPGGALGAGLEALERGLAGAGLVVDALFGVGLTRSLSSPFVEAIERINASAALRLAVDVPSGLDCDRGVPRPVCVEAHVTATMAAPKRGLSPGAPGATAAGQVVEIDIGLPWAIHAPYLRDPRPA